MIKLSFLNLFRRKTRTLLSVGGIAIGVAVIIVLVSIVDGFTMDFEQLVGEFRGISVWEKNSQDNVFSRVDVSFKSKLASLPNVRAVIPEIFVLPKKIDGSNIGVTSVSPPSVYGLGLGEYYSSGSSGWISDVEKGSMLGPSDSGYVLIGKKIAGDFQKFVGSPIRVDGKDFRVRGILKSRSQYLENIIVMNLGDARELSNLPDGKVSTYTLYLSNPSKDSATANLVEAKFGDKVMAFTQADLSKQLDGITGSLRLLAIAVAAISGIVGGIGIMNTMLMSVLERFREIGSLKAVGWSRDDIMKMILYESAFLGLIGGFLGVLLGFGVDSLLFSVAQINYHVSGLLVASSFLFALVLGLGAGAYPALYASGLSPVDALRG